MLHITNGDAVTGTMREAALPGQYLPWRDVLHDGPVPGGLTLHEMSDVRARALADFGAGDYAGLRASFAERDRVLEDFRQHEEVVLWFEHDLYDQLQLIQLLDWFTRQELGATKLSIIQIDSHPDVIPFNGLGELNASQLGALLPARKPVTREQLSAGGEAWSAFTAADPRALLALSQSNSAVLPFISAALGRFLQEYPGTADGLSRIERQILRAVAAGARKKSHIYFASSKDEDVPWGDASVYLRMDWLASAETPALQPARKDGFALTDAGKKLLEGQADWIALCGGIDRWLGGVHLKGKQAAWRWDEQAETLASE